MLSETEIRLILGILTAIETGIFGQMLFAFIYEHAKSKKSKNTTLRGVIGV